MQLNSSQIAMVRAALYKKADYLWQSAEQCSEVKLIDQLNATAQENYTLAEQLKDIKQLESKP